VSLFKCHEKLRKTATVYAITQVLKVCVIVLKRC
jgi:hypothetical protein